MTTIPLTANQIIRYAKYEVVGGTHWANSEIEIWGDPMPPSSVNLAFRQGVATTDHTYAGSSPARAIDGDWGSEWNGGDFGSPGNPFWLQVDLQKTYKVDKIVLVFSHTSTYAGQTNVYNLYTSADGINWNLVSSGTLVDSLDPAVYVTTIPLTANQIIRYAKYEVVGGTHRAIISEMETWGDPLPVPVPSSHTTAPILLLLLN